MIIDSVTTVIDLVPGRNAGHRGPPAGPAGNGSGPPEHGGWETAFDWELPTGPRHARRPPPGRRLLATAAVLAVDALSVGMTEAGTGGPLRLLIGLAFVLAVPGWAVVGWLRLGWPAAELSLGVAASLAIVLLGSEVMLWVHRWHPVDLQLALGSVSAVLLIGQLLRNARRVAPR